MSSLDKAVQTQLDNIQKKTGKSLDELAAREGEVALPGYTHMQQAMPSSVATRALGYIEIDLYFYSDESRQGRRGGKPMKYTVARAKPVKEAEIRQNEGDGAPPSGRRAYTKPPLSSYRP